MSAMPLSRRRFVVAGSGAAFAAGVGGIGLVEARVLPGRTSLHSALGLTGRDGEVPEAPPGPRVSGAFRSSARGGVQVHWSAAYPPGSDGTEKLPIALAMHGRGEDHSYAFDRIGLDRFLTKVVRAGTPPFVIVSVDGGDTSFWHRRESGDDPPSMIRTELLPRLAQRNLVTARIGLIGWSMGGYGALLYAEREPEMVAAVVAASPALWQDYAEVQPGAFDGSSDFAANDVYAARPILHDVPLRIDCGTDDPFVEATQAFVRGLPREPEGGFQPGAHTAGYWRRVAGRQLAFLGERLADRIVVS